MQRQSNRQKLAFIGVAVFHTHRRGLIVHDIYQYETTDIIIF